MTDSDYVDPTGCHQGGEAVDAVAGAMLGFCGCGDPAAALEFVLRGLDLIALLRDKETPWDERYAKYQADCAAHFGSRGAEYFFWYWCDNEGLTEHGGSVPGWLTERGYAQSLTASGSIAPTGARTGADA